MTSGKANPSSGDTGITAKSGKASVRISEHYNLSFTAASLRPELARIIAEQYLVEQDWQTAKLRILSSNALQSRNKTSSIRIERELRNRLMILTGSQLTLLARATAEDRAALAWLAACKHVQFAFEFAVEVLRDKLATHDPVLRHSDYEGYFDNKTLSHPELARLTPSSKSKIRQVLMKMLAEGGLLERGTALGTIQRPVVSPEVVQVIVSDDPHWLAAFLVPDIEIPSR